MQFYKYQGAGNDFILLDQRQQRWLGREDTERIAFLCSRHFGIGADGLILLHDHSDFDFEMIYFNADGRESSMCGNGGRCMVAFARQVGIERAQYRFLAIDGPHEAVLTNWPNQPTWVELQMRNVPAIKDLAPRHHPTTTFLLDTGSPHYVRFVSALDDLDLVQEGRAVRYSEPFRADGVNVNLVEETPGCLRIRTYERGVEDETLACGTGVTAAALAHHIRQRGATGPQEVPVQAKGGDLSVRFLAHADGSFSDIWLCGPAMLVFSGEI